MSSNQRFMKQTENSNADCLQRRVRPQWWRKTDDRNMTRTHLAFGGDSAICGEDLIGGDPRTSGAKDPERLKSKSRITCEACKLIIGTVREHDAA
jgi:hypothetical protein